MSLQGRNLSVRPRLASRRLDWTVYIIQTELQYRHVIDEVARKKGMQRNDMALNLVRTAILKAKEHSNPTQCLDFMNVSSEL